MDHLKLEIFDLDDENGKKSVNSQFAVLPPDASITITDTSEIFASGDVWSYSFTLNTAANAHIFGTAGELHGARLHEQIDKRRARLWVEDVPLFLGYLKLADEVDVDEDGNVDVSFESGQKTFENLIDGGKANQVPMMGDVPIGMALWRKRWTKIEVKMAATCPLMGDTYMSMPMGEVHVNGSENITFVCDGEDEENSVQEFPRMVFPRGHFESTIGEEDWDDNCLNTDYAYDDAHPFCNVPLCYQQYGYRKKDENGIEIDDYSSEPEAQREYEYMPADRVNSAPNFFVIYWIRALMKHLGIHIEENQMTDVEDLKRLFLVNTNCAYKVPKKLRTASTGSKDLRYGRYRYNGGTPDLGYEGSGVKSLIPEYIGSMDGNIKDNSSMIGTNVVSSTGEKVDVSIKVWEVLSHPTHHKYPDEYREKNNFFHRAYATSDCFPNVDIADVIKAVESGFGVRFLFSDDYRRVRIVLMRNIFRNTDIQDIACDILSDTKEENNIRGFRMTYGNSEDTHFYYKGFADKLPHMKVLWPDESDEHDYSQWKLDAVYGSIINRISAFDKTCYVTPNTGNAFGIKVDKNAKRYNDLHPSLFEFAAFMDAEDGDCTGQENTIHTVDLRFTPAIMNDLNMKEEREAAGDADRKQRFALFVDEAMRPRRPDLLDLPNNSQPGVKSYNDPDAFYDINKLYSDTSPAAGMKEGGIVKPGEFAIVSDTYVNIPNAKSDVKSLNPWREFHLTFGIEGYFNEGIRLYLQDNYEPNDDGISPIEKHDWGLTLGVMRGSGSDAFVRYNIDQDDGEGNDTWEIQSGSQVTSHPDTCDCYGNEFAYNGETRVTVNSELVTVMRVIYISSNIDVAYSSPGILRDRNTYISGAVLQTVTADTGDKILLLFATTLGPNGRTILYHGKIKDYASKFNGMSVFQMMDYDAGPNGFGILVETYSSQERMNTFLEYQKQAFVDGSIQTPVIIDQTGTDSRFGRFSLKLRAEKPNPYFDPAQPESDSNRRYLQIDNENLRGRGLSDQFYKEFSYWIRNARISRKTVHMELAQLLSIDKTVRVRVGDTIGFIRKMQYTVSNSTGLGLVEMEIMYI